ncbi:Membrane protein PM19L [Linum grandiflorum]
MAMGRGLMSPMLIVNLVVLFIVLGLAAWSLDKYINGQQNHPHLGGNESTILMLLYALIAGAVGAASTLFGFIHLRSWTTRSLASASSLALFSWALAALSFGYFNFISFSWFALGLTMVSAYRPIHNYIAASF